MIPLPLALIGVGVLLGLSAFFSASESALFSINRLKLQKFESSGSPTERLIAKVLSHPKNIIIDILIWNNIVNVAVSSLATIIAFELFNEAGLAIAAGIMTLLLLVFGEILPKTMAVRKSESVAKFVIGPLMLFSFLASPFRSIFSAFSDKCNDVIGKRLNLQRPDLTEEELKTIIEVSEKEGVLDPAEKEMISGVLDFSDTTAGDIMTPRVDVVAANSQWTHQHMISFLKKHFVAKIPVYEGSIDKIIGMVYAKEILLNNSKNYRHFIRPIIIVPESKKVHLILNELKAKNAKIAVVLDEYGGTAGILTLEDLLEEIFGEIHDEFEEEVKEIVRRSDGKFHVLGRAHLDDVNTRMGSQFPTTEFNTVNGLLLGIAGHLPLAGDVFTYKGWKFTIEKVSKRRVLSAVVEKVKHK